MRIRSTGNGEPGTNGGPPGDLYIEIRLKKHDIFERDGDDLHCVVPISIATAALGGEIEVPTLAGKAAIDIPEGTQTGKQFRLRGKGIKGVRSSYPGDLYCHITVETPVKLTEHQRKLLGTRRVAEKRRRQALAQRRQLDRPAEELLQLTICRLAQPLTVAESCHARLFSHRRARSWQPDGDLRHERQHHLPRRRRHRHRLQIPGPARRPEPAGGLRPVPGLQAAAPAQLDAAAGAARPDRCRDPDPRPPGPQRLPAAAGPRGFRRPCLCHARHARPVRASCCPTAATSRKKTPPLPTAMVSPSTRRPCRCTRARTRWTACR